LYDEFKRCCLKGNELSKILVLVRHATATTNDPSGDFYRPLNSEGIAEAKLTANKLLQIWGESHYAKPEIVSSPAVRTKQTAAEIVHTFAGDSRFGSQFDIDIENDLYRGEPEDWYSLIHHIYLHSQALVIVGHNPGISFIASELVNQAINFRPSDFVVLKQALGGELNEVEKWQIAQGSIRF
jgi:phosphohistidine phosphatase